MLLRHSFAVLFSFYAFSPASRCARYRVTEGITAPQCQQLIKQR